MIRYELYHTLGSKGGHRSTSSLVISWIEIYIFLRRWVQFIGFLPAKEKEALLTEKAVFNIRPVIGYVNSPWLYDHAKKQTRFVSFHLHLSNSSLAAEKIRKSFYCNAGFESFTAARETSLMIRLRRNCNMRGRKGTQDRSLRPFVVKQNIRK